MYEIVYVLYLTLIIQKDLKVLFRKIAWYDLTETEEWNCIEPLSMKKLSILFLSMRRYRVIDSD